MWDQRVPFNINCQSLKSSFGFSVNPLVVQGSSPHLIWVNSQAPNVCADERVVM